MYLQPLFFFFFFHLFFIDDILNLEGYVYYIYSLAKDNTYN